ncbi:MAG: carboxypeptidase M32 [Gaiellales bacterium]
MGKAYEELKTRLGEVVDLAGAAAVLNWDHRTKMPRNGAVARSEQLGTLSKIVHTMFASPEVGQLLDEAEPWAEEQGYDSLEASLVRVVRRDYEKLVRVPPELSAELSRTAAIAEPVWQEARKASDWPKFQPYLEKILELRRRYVDCFEPADEDYDHLLDIYEPGMKTAEVRAVFDELKAGLVPLIAEVAERADAVDDSFLTGDFPIDAQKRVEGKILADFGFTEDSWRLDETVHPFATRSGMDDIRLTTKHLPSSLSSIFSSMHEFGHGIYEYGGDRAFARTPLARGTSLGFHESQSRMWENLVGRSRPFWQHYFPLVQGAFPSQLNGVDAEGFYRGVNRVQPSLIRIEADEATYNLHIILRFELEQEMITGRLAAADVPEAWDAKMHEYLGIEVPDVADGALQDSHWSGGSMGYFSTYALGNVVSAQLWLRISDEIPDVYEQIGRGEFAPLREWLREHVHQHGRKYMPQELLQRVTGSGLDPKPLLAYLRRKLGEIYALDS